MQVLVFGIVTAGLLACWGLLKFAPSATGPGSARPAATESAGSYQVLTLQELPANETRAEARAREQNTEIRMLGVDSISVAIRKVVGPEMSEQKVVQTAMQTIVLCPTRAQAKQSLIANGLPSADVKAIMAVACPLP